MALAGASWTLAASELWVIAQRAMPGSARGRISALMMVLSQGAMTVGGVVWGLSAEIAGTRVTLLAAAFLFFITIAGWTLLLRHWSGAIDGEGQNVSFCGVVARMIEGISNHQVVGANIVEVGDGSAVNPNKLQT